MLAQSAVRTVAAAAPAAHLGVEDQTIDIVLANDAHAAFVWGVLDRLLDQPNCNVSGVTASGFAAMQAAVFAYGLSVGGRRGARTALANFWRRVSHASMFAIDRTSLLRSMLEQSIDLNRIRDEDCPVKLDVLAINARTDALKIFSGEQLSVDAIVAAATVPFLSPAIEIDGDLYWGDGDISQLQPVALGGARNRLMVTGKPSIFVARCPDRSLASTHCATGCAAVHTIFDSQYRAAAPLLLRPWIDWGQLTDIRDRGRQCAENWLAANLSCADERPAFHCRTQYI
jgi:NTE family protein